MIFANLPPCAVSPDTDIPIQTPVQRQIEIQNEIEDGLKDRRNLALSGGPHHGKTTLLKEAFKYAPKPQGFEVLTFAKTSLKEWLNERQKVAVGKQPESRVFVICADTLRLLHEHNASIDRQGWASRKLILGGKPVGSHASGYISNDAERHVARTRYIARFLIDELDTTSFHTVWRRDEFEEFALKCYEFRDCVQLFTAMNQTFEEWRQSYNGDNTYWKLFNPKQTLCINMKGKTAE